MEEERTMRAGENNIEATDTVTHSVADIPETRKHELSKYGTNKRVSPLLVRSNFHSVKFVLFKVTDVMHSVRAYCCPTTVTMQIWSRSVTSESALILTSY